VNQASKWARIGLAAVCGLACASALAANPQGAKKGLYRSAFVRGDASSKARPHVAPRSEREAVARKTYLANGIVAMELPEDRMVNLVAVRQPDGSVVMREETPDGVQAVPAVEVPRE